MNSLKGGAGRKEEVFQTFFFSFLHGIRSLLWSGEKKYKLPLSYPSSSYFYTNVSGYKSKAEKRKTNLFSSLVWPNVVVRLKHWLCQKMTPPKKEKWKMHLTRGANQEEDDGGRRRRKGLCCWRNSPMAPISYHKYQTIWQKLAILVLSPTLPANWTVDKALRLKREDEARGI